MLRAVLDTNVVLAAKRSVHPQSPNAEIITRWMAGEFVWLVSDDVVTEYAEKLLEKGIDPLNVEQLVADLLQYGEEVPIRFFHFHHYPVDMDDVAFLLAAINGAATHVVTYDEHLKDVGGVLF
ncbi:MAG: PIN domain-containing protein [Verrucomicrobia bacterium]|nr:PIN domain-containing protein [Verrucomicrobiota bacterium]